MISDSKDRLFGGVNAIIAEKVSRILEGCHKEKMKDDSVSDLDIEAKPGSEELNELNSSYKKPARGIRKEIEDRQRKSDLQDIKDNKPLDIKDNMSGTAKIVDNESPEKLKEDYIPFMKKEDWDSQVSSSKLQSQDGGNNRIEALDDQGNTQGWWNDHTGVGYIHKHCCEPAIQESEADPLKPNAVGDAIVTDQPIKN